MSLYSVTISLLLVMTIISDFSSNSSRSSRSSSRSFTAMATDNNSDDVNWKQIARDEHGYNIVRHPYLLKQSEQNKNKRLLHPKELLMPFEYLLKEAAQFNSEQNINKRISESDKRLYDLETFIEMVSAPSSRDHWLYSSEKEAIMAAQPVGNSSKCGEDLNYIVELIGLNKPNGMDGQHLFTSGHSIKLLEFVESFGRPTQETYLGDSNWLGSYRECLRSQIPRYKLSTLDNNHHQNNSDYKQSSENIIYTRYCVGKMVAKSWQGSDYYNVKLVPPTTMKVGLCLPEACDSVTAFNLYNDTIDKIAKLNFPHYLKDRFELSSGIYCLPDERSPMRQWTLASCLFITFCLMWLYAIAVFSVKYCWLECWHQQTTTYKQRQLSYGHLLAVGANIKHFLDLNDSTTTTTTTTTTTATSGDHSPSTTEYSMYSRVNLNAIDFLKVTLSVLVIFGHSYTSIGWMVTNTTFNIEQGVFWPNSLSFALLRTVDVFFVLGGMLATYVILKKFNNNYHEIIRPKVWFMINLQRFLRLSPLYMLVYAYEKTIEVYMGKGPWWDYGTNRHTSYRGNCIQSSTWYKMILLLGNFGDNPIPDCNGISWYLVADSQIFLLVPFLIYFIIRLGVRKSALFLLMPITSLVAYKLTLDLQQQQVMDLSKLYQYGLMYSFNLIVKFSSIGYTGSLYRLSSVTFGLYAGYCLHLYEKQEIKQWPQWMKGTSFKLILLVATISYIVQYPLVGYIHMVHDVPVDLNQMLLVGFLGNFVTPAVTCVILLRLCTDFTMILPTQTNNNNNNIIKCFLRHKMWRIVGKLTYCFYLIHLNVILYILTSYQEARPAATLMIEVLKVSLLTFVITFVLSFLLYILFELPMARLLTRLTSLLVPASQKKRQKTK